MMEARIRRVPSSVARWGGRDSMSELIEFLFRHGYSVLFGRRRRAGRHSDPCRSRSAGCGRPDRRGPALWGCSPARVGGGFARRRPHLVPAGPQPGTQSPQMDLPPYAGARLLRSTERRHLRALQGARAPRRQIHPGLECRSSADGGPPGNEPAELPPVRPWQAPFSGPAPFSGSVSCSACRSRTSL